MKLLLPVLKKLRQVLERIPTRKLPDRLRKPLENLKSQLDNFFQKANDIAPIPPNSQPPTSSSNATSNAARAGNRKLGDLIRSVKASGASAPEKVRMLKEGAAKIDGVKFEPAPKFANAGGSSWAR